MTIADNLASIQERISKAALRAGRNPAEIRLVAVSKTVSAENIQQAIAAGVTILGENYVQEARNKIARIGKSGCVALYRPPAIKQGQNMLLTCSR